MSMFRNYSYLNNQIFNCWVDSLQFCCYNSYSETCSISSQRKKGAFLLKTAMIKTNLWDDDEFYELNIDTKIVYLLLLTSPERGVGRIYKMSDRILSARSGLNIDQINICKKQLAKKKLVNFFEGWVQLTESSSFVQPVKGKLTVITLERELADIPENVLDKFLLTDEISPVKDMSVSGETHVHDNDNDHDSVNDTDNVVYGKPEINEMFSYWHEVVGYKIESNQKNNRNACSNLLKKYKAGGLKQLITAVSFAQNDKFAPRISDFISLQSRTNDLLAWAKKKGSSNAVAQF